MSCLTSIAGSPPQADSPRATKIARTAANAFAFMSNLHELVIYIQTLGSMTTVTINLLVRAKRMLCGSGAGELVIE